MTRAWSSMYRERVITPPGTGSTFLAVGAFSVVAAIETLARADRCCFIALAGAVVGPTKASLCCRRVARCRGKRGDQRYRATATPIRMYIEVCGGWERPPMKLVCVHCVCILCTGIPLRSKYKNNCYGATSDADHVTKRVRMHLALICMI